MFYFLLIIAIPFLSCKKFLDKKPDSRLTVPQTLSDLQALLDASQIMNLQQSPSFGEASSDDYFIPMDAYNMLPVEHQGIYIWNSDEYRFQNDWSKAYLPVYNANYSLEQLENIPVTPANSEQWKNVKGSAHFFRAYNYLNLLWVYAKAYDEASADSDFGIVLRNGSDFNVPSVRATVRRCYEQVIADTKEAVGFLPSSPVHVMRPSKTAAYGLLARCYLSMRKYDSAYLYADLCLHLKSSLMDYNGDGDINGSISANTPFKKFNKETIFYTEMNGNSYIIFPSGINIDTTLITQYHLDDLRKAAFYKPVSGYHQFKGSYSGTQNQYFTGISTSEMYLTRAEAHARAGRITEAMNDLNTLIQKRWRNSVPYPFINASDQSEAVDKILAERRKELYMRGLRWIDIKRLNKEGQNIILHRMIGQQNYTLQPNGSYYALPLPTDIIEQTGIPQN
jgi:hypothetical protein